MPRTYPLYGNRSNSNDDSVIQSHRLKGSSSLFRASVGSSLSASSSNSSNPPHRLKDNLHWRCSNCNSLVTTSETGAHLIGCLIDLVGPFIGSELLVETNDSHSDSHQMNSSATVQHRSSDRPRTKKLERPTPNIKHPVIDETNLETDDDDSSIRNGLNGSVSCSCRKLINQGPIKTIPENGVPTNPLETSKCNFTHRAIDKGHCSSNRTNSGWSGGGRVYPPAPPPTSNIRSETTKKVCNSCERSSVPERLHSHHGKSSHHHHPNQSSRVNTSPTKDKRSTKETNNSKSPTVKSSQRSSVKVQINSKSNIKGTPSVTKLSMDNGTSPEDENEEDDKDEENGRNKTNLLDNDSLDDPSDQNNYLSPQMKCYLCRQDFGTDEIEIHEIECLEKWKHDHSVLSPNQRVPIVSTQGIGGGNDHRGSFSSLTGCDPAGWEHFKSQLTPCPKCGRTFFPHRLAAHEKVCLGPQAGKRSKNGPGQTRSTVHTISGKDTTQISQYPKYSKKPVPGHQRVGQFTCNKYA